MLRDLCDEQDKGTKIFCDNSSTISFSKNYIFYKRKKHIDAKFHFIRELVNNGEIIFQHCRSEENFSDILTKPLGQKSFVYLRQCLGVVECGSCD